MGLPTAQFDTNGKLIAKWNMRNDTLSGPVSFNFINIKKIQQSSFKDEINANPLVLYFDFNQVNYNVNAQEYLKIKDLIRYILVTPGATVLIVGHSDSSGNAQTNRLLAKERAEFTKKYLVKNGIEFSRIETQSKGSNEPVAKNASPEGMVKNRRTVITIK